MSPQKGTPEHDAWRLKLSTKAKKRFSDPDERQKFLQSGEKGRFVKGQIAHNKGKPMSEEQLAKMRQLKPTADQIARMSATKRGKKLSEEHRKKIGDTHKGMKRSAEAKASMSKARKGRKSSPESIAKMAETKRGKPSGRKGTHHSEETRAKLSAMSKGKPRPDLRGIKHDAAFSAMASERNRKRWASLTEEERCVHLDKLHREIITSKPEEAVAAWLDGQGIVYERQKRIGWYRVDFYISTENRIIEVNGCYWHCCEQCGYDNAHLGKHEKDTKRYEYLRGKGYTVEVVWEHDLIVNTNFKG